MKKAGKLVTGLLGLAMAVTTILPAMAAPSAVYDKKVELPPGMLWTFGGEVTYNGDKYAGGKAVCESVYPSEGVDYYNTIRYRITEYYGTVISVDPYVKITEGAGYRSVAIKRAYDYLGHIYFQFQGNTVYPANAIVSFDGLAMPILP